VNKVLEGNPERMRQHGRPRRRWEDGIRNCMEGWGLDSTGSG
jgi:hypothetical protein